MKGIGRWRFSQNYGLVGSSRSVRVEAHLLHQTKACAAAGDRSDESCIVQCSRPGNQTTELCHFGSERVLHLELDDLRIDDTISWLALDSNGFAIQAQDIEQAWRKGPNCLWPQR